MPHHPYPCPGCGVLLDVRTPIDNPDAFAHPASWCPGCGGRGVAYDTGHPATVARVAERALELAARGGATLPHSVTRHQLQFVAHVLAYDLGLCENHEDVVSSLSNAVELDLDVEGAPRTRLAAFINELRVRPTHHVSDELARQILWAVR